MYCIGKLDFCVELEPAEAKGQTCEMGKQEYKSFSYVD